MSRVNSSLSLDVNVFHHVIDTGDVETRIKLATELASFVVAEETPQVERDMIVPVLLRLGKDDEARVRQAQAEALVTAEQLHPDILFAIVSDDNEIALPFLSATPALNRSRALAILRVGDSARQMVLATRNQLPKDVVAEIVAGGEIDVCAALLDNEEIELSADDCRRLYVRYRDEEAITDRLLQRDALPLEVKILQAKRVANKVHTMMAERGWLPANDTEEIVVDAEEATLLKILETAPTEELDRIIPVLCSQDMLTPSIILRAICRGHIGIAVRSIAFLSSIPTRKLNRIFSVGSPAHMKSVFAKAGLPRSCFDILQAAIDVARDNRGVKLEGPDQFGRQVVEALVTRYGHLNLTDKADLLDIVARACDERTRAIARKLKMGLEQAA